MFWYVTENRMKKTRPPAKWLLIRQTSPSFLTMSTMSAMVRINMADMAQVFLAHLVLSIQVEKATSFFGKT